jgi:hypothetical protein
LHLEILGSFRPDCSHPGRSPSFRSLPSARQHESSLEILRVDFLFSFRAGIWKRRVEKCPG